MCVSLILCERVSITVFVNVTVFLSLFFCLLLFVWIWELSFILFLTVSVSLYLPIFRCVSAYLSLLLCEGLSFILFLTLSVCLCLPFSLTVSETVSFSVPVSTYLSLFRWCRPRYWSKTTISWNPLLSLSRKIVNQNYFFRLCVTKRFHYLVRSFIQKDGSLPSQINAC